MILYPGAVRAPVVSLLAAVYTRHWMGNRIGKGKGNDATQDVSLSQFVPPKLPDLTKPPTISRGSQKNDMSLWGGVVVGTSDFAPAPTKKARKNTWKWIAAAGAVAGVGIAAVLLIGGGDSKTPVTPVAPVASVDKPVATPPVEKPAEKPPEKPADTLPGTPAAAPTEAPAATGGSGSAAPTVAALTGNVDAISGVAPVIKPKPAAKKKVPARKKTAKATLKKKIVPKKKK